MPPFDTRRGLLAALLLGALLAALSSFGDGSGIVIVNALANAASPWLLTAFGAGALQRTMGRAAVAGLLALLVALAWYYGRFVVDGVAAPVALIVAWSFIVAVAGPLMGTVGWSWAARTDRWRTLSVSLLAAALLAEAAHRLILLEAWDGIDLGRTYAQLALANAIVAVGLPVALLERERWLPTFVAVPAMASAGLGVLLVVEATFATLVGGGQR